MKPLLLALLLAPAVAPAATFNVTRLDDPTPNGCTAADCSLREAVLAANAAAGSDTVVLGSGVHTLRQQSLSAPLTVAVDSGIAFTGAGRDLTRVEGRGRGSLFNVSGVKVSFAAMTLSKGNATWASTSPSGGAIRVVQGVLRLSGVRVSDNRAIDGGGLHLVGSTLELIDSAVEANTADHYGGGVFALDSTLRLRSASAVRENLAGWGGGGIAAGGELLGDDDCEVSGNAAGRGGGVLGADALLVQGIATAGGDGLFGIEANVADAFDEMWQLPTGNGGGLYTPYDIEIERVAIVGNRSNSVGGGMSAYVGGATIRDSHVAANFAELGGGGLRLSGSKPALVERVGIDGNVSGRYGGGMQLGSGADNVARPVTLRNVDFHDNHAQQHGALFNDSALTMSHVTFWNNTDDLGAAAVVQDDIGSTTYSNSLLLGRCVGTAIFAQGINLVTPEATDRCAGVSPSSAPMHLSHATFGGRFPVTGTDNPGSAIIAMGRRELCIAEDVRGFARDTECDAGAFEYGAD